MKVKWKDGIVAELGFRVSIHLGHLHTKISSHIYPTEAFSHF